MTLTPAACARRNFRQVARLGAARDRGRRGARLGDGTRHEADAELLQARQRFAVAPAGVLPREADDQVAALRRDRWPAGTAAGMPPALPRDTRDASERPSPASQSTQHGASARARERTPRRTPDLTSEAASLRLFGQTHRTRRGRRDPRGQRSARGPSRGAAAGASNRSPPFGCYRWYDRAPFGG